MSDEMKETSEQPRSLDGLVLSCPCEPIVWTKELEQELEVALERVRHLRQNSGAICKTSTYDAK